MKSLFSRSINNGTDLSRRAKLRNHSARWFKCARLASILCLLALDTSRAFGADAPQATVAYRPGDMVRIVVTFKGPINLKYGDLRLVLNGELPEGQKVFTNSFDLTTMVKLSETEYEFDVKVTDHMASGTYRLLFIAATDNADFSRNFSAGPDCPSIAVCIRNDRHVEFPDIKTIRVGGEATAKP